ncbi:MAG: hypothetical protein RL329_3455 [Bacteroidota bacterium]|jgi:hypothetical protein
MGYFFWVLLILSTMITLLTIPDTLDEAPCAGKMPLHDAGDNPLETEAEPPHAVREKIFAYN